MPALLTRQSIRPKRSRICSSVGAWRGEIGEVALDEQGLGAPRAQLLGGRGALLGSTSVIARSKLSASLAAIARPMPRPAPVTMATGRDDAVMVSSRCGD